MTRLAGFLKRLTERLVERLTVQQIAAGLLLIGAVVGLGGFANEYCMDWCVWMPSAPILLSEFLGDFYANIAVDCLSVAFAILVIDGLNERRAERELKAQLIRAMGSTDNTTALHTIEELRAHGWLRGSPRQRMSLDKWR
jgi:hypothetical protein